MDFGALPPEVNSGRMYLGPGPATLLAASAGWDSLALETELGGQRLRIGGHDPDGGVAGPDVDVDGRRGRALRGVAAGHRRAVRAVGDAGHRRRGGLRSGVRDDGAAAAHRGQPRSAHGVDRDQLPGAEHAGDHGHRGRVQRDVGPGRHRDVHLRRQLGVRVDLQHLRAAAPDDQSGSGSPAKPAR